LEGIDGCGEKHPKLSSLKGLGFPDFIHKQRRLVGTNLGVKVYEDIFINIWGQGREFLKKEGRGKRLLFF